ncbi:hypothetical protein BZA05DRAFT_155634 [Tricharina praecox]|uniref:uncharacterized protein n=1 Tax=Tricharina praecox TaxID=43433 RepID=UPI0022204EF4|nr:uncharacterized protein BZA05DRAFT_155634 [Tricharina praecox]KAI5844682.1 hypothetical protein BZA05DRAFT_155634 [Tricharina praecox]
MVAIPFPPTRSRSAACLRLDVSACAFIFTAPSNCFQILATPHTCRSTPLTFRIPTSQICLFSATCSFSIVTRYSTLATAVDSVPVALSYLESRLQLGLTIHLPVSPASSSRWPFSVPYKPSPAVAPILLPHDRYQRRHQSPPPPAHPRSIEASAGMPTLWSCLFNCAIRDVSEAEYPPATVIGSPGTIASPVRSTYIPLARSLGNA